MSEYRCEISTPLSLSVIDFSFAAHTFFVKMARSAGLGEKEGFLRIRTVPAVVVVFEEGGEFPLSLKEELGHSRILRSSIPMVLGIRGLVFSKIIKDKRRTCA
ncbi:hypothetical protein AVEN_92970-1 [Araneus ventricosus]|uniref:Uncharacterized protein n=1 Tax=Araneus ventricosus TaxID=182803 RepID=A0A4Y2TQ85_ARAVE|nr:hypothetical protein AVEN_92970-1 [Araneus ventricosus]